MVILKLSELTTQELITLFPAMLGLDLSHRASRILDELEKRGYIFDLRYRDFIPCDEWNIRHGNYTPMDCEQWAVRRVSADSQ
jgi:hypothetical protein